MNRVIPFVGSLLLLTCTAVTADRVEEHKTWTESFPVTASEPTLEISNIWGDVRVRPGKSGQISITIEEHRSAPDQGRFDRSLESLKLRTRSSENGVSMYVGRRYRDSRDYNHCRGCRVDYQFEVVVPVNTQLDVSTVNDGRIDVSGVANILNAGNVNGPISISELRRCEAVDSVNGAVSLSFSHAPGADCDIETVNGDITVRIPPGAGLDVAVDLFNGRMTSELPVDPMAIPAKVEHSQSDGHHRYRIDQPAGVRIAGGGPTFTISSLNGDIRIQNTQ